MDRLTKRSMVRTRWGGRLAGMACGLLLLLGGAGGWAQPAAPPARDGGAAAAPAKAVRVAPDSPRASLSRYLDLCRAGRFAEAARYLDLPPALAGRGPELARRLKAVLDRHIWFDMAAISPLAAGNRSDGLPPDTEELAEIPGTGGAAEPVYFVRRAGQENAPWRFSRATVERIDAWYGQLGNRWVLEHLPGPLLRPGPRELLWWQWLALVLLGLVAWLLGRLLSWITRLVAGRVVRRTKTEWDDIILERIGEPLTLAWALILGYVLLPWLGLYQPAQTFIHVLLRVGFLLVVFWSLLRIVDIIARIIGVSTWAQEHPASRSLVPLGARVGKVTVLAMALVAVLWEFGYPVASLVAGLGIGGLALALAAQKTVENLFGAFSIGLDQPFREGDFVKVEDFVGTVEAIGLRSTKIRTLDRTIVTMPNGKLADMRLETFSARDRMRLACVIGLVYETTAAQMRAVLEGFERVLRAHPKNWPDAVVVRFKEFADSSLNIEIMAWFVTSEWSEFQLIRQEILLQFMEVVERAGTSFAFPTRTVHLVGGPPAGAVTP